MCSNSLSPRRTMFQRNSRNEYYKRFDSCTIAGSQTRHMFFFLYFSYHSGVILDSKVFDTYGIISAGRNLRDYLNNIKGKYVISFRGQVDRRPISINPKLNCNLGFFILLFKTPFGLIFCVLFRASNSHILDKKKLD